MLKLQLAHAAEKEQLHRQMEQMHQQRSEDQERYVQLLQAQNSMQEEALRQQRLAQQAEQQHAHDMIKMLIAGQVQAAFCCLSCSREHVLHHRHVAIASPG